MAGGRGPPRPGHYSRAPGGEQPLPGLLREDPRLYVFAEEAIKAQVQKRVGRGKVDVFVSIDSSAADKVEVTLNRPVADGYYAAPDPDAGYLQPAGRHFGVAPLPVPRCVPGGKKSRGTPM